VAPAAADGGGAVALESGRRATPAALGALKLAIAVSPGVTLISICEGL
jgi:hypothetical protein